MKLQQPILQVFGWRKKRYTGAVVTQVSLPSTASVSTGALPPRPSTSSHDKINNCNSKSSNRLDMQTFHRLLSKIPKLNASSSEFDSSGSSVYAFSMAATSRTSRSNTLRPTTKDSTWPNSIKIVEDSDAISLSNESDFSVHEPLMSDSQSDVIPPSVRPIKETTYADVNYSGLLALPDDDYYHQYQDQESPRPRTAPATSLPSATFSPSHNDKSSFVPITTHTWESDYATSTRPSTVDSNQSFDTTTSTASSMFLPPLQSMVNSHEEERLDPILEDDPESFDLVSPPAKDHQDFNIEQRADDIFSTNHLKEIFHEPDTMLKFTRFLSRYRSSSVPVLIYYLDAIKALKAINYANAIAEALGPIPGVEFTSQMVQATANKALEKRANDAFDILVRDDLPAYISHVFIQIINQTLYQRVTGKMPLYLREASEGVGEVFCLTDPSREDNPIVFTSEEFHRTTQYGVDYSIGRNCRFLQGPKTGSHSVQRLTQATKEGKEVNELLINYRRDGSPFMNLVTVAPLSDSKGLIRYYLGTQVDVTGLCKDATELESLHRLLKKSQNKKNTTSNDAASTAEPGNKEMVDEFQELTEMFNDEELDIVKKYGGRMQENFHILSQKSERIITPVVEAHSRSGYTPIGMGLNTSLFQNYLLVRPYPSLRIIFTSPSLRTPGILQSQFLSRIGGSQRVRNELSSALASGNGVTAKVRWLTGRSVGSHFATPPPVAIAEAWSTPSSSSSGIESSGSLSGSVTGASTPIRRHGSSASRVSSEVAVASAAAGSPRWVHCTPLLGRNGSVGVWMVVLVDEQGYNPVTRFKEAPPVATNGEILQSEKTKMDEKSRRNSLIWPVDQSDASG